MRKLIFLTPALLLTAALLLSFCGCGSEAITHSAEREEHISDYENALEENSEEYRAILPMISSVEAFLEYSCISNPALDMENLSAEDFWNITALTISAYNAEDERIEVDNVGVYHMEWEDLLDFCKTFLYEHWFKHNTPSYKDSYAASADPGSGVMDLVPLAVSNFDYKLLYIEPVSIRSLYSKTVYIAYIDLTARGDETVYHYAVYLDEWPDSDDAEHFFPYMMSDHKLLSIDYPE